MVSRENCKKAKVKPKRFLDNFATDTDSPAERHPFFYKRIDGVSYMIVDYRCEKGRCYGVAFVLMESKDGHLSHRMVIGNEFADADENDWQNDWKANGSSPNAYGNIGWYEDQFHRILKSAKKSKEVLG